MAMAPQMAGDCPDPRQAGKLVIAALWLKTKGGLR